MDFSQLTLTLPAGHTKIVMKCTTLVANASNMSVAAHEVSIITSVVIAKYLRDVGRVADYMHAFDIHECKWVDTGQKNLVLHQGIDNDPLESPFILVVLQFFALELSSLCEFLSAAKVTIDEETREFLMAKVHNFRIFHERILSLRLVPVDNSFRSLLVSLICVNENTRSRLLCLKDILVEFESQFSLMYDGAYEILVIYNSVEIPNDAISSIIQVRKISTGHVQLSAYCYLHNGKGFVIGVLPIHSFEVNLQRKGPLLVATIAILDELVEPFPAASTSISDKAMSMTAVSTCS